MLDTVLSTCICSYYFPILEISKIRHTKVKQYSQEIKPVSSEKGYKSSSD